MTREDFLAGLATLNAPDQGMRYHSGGADHDAPSFDEATGDRLPPRFRDAELVVHGGRARFLYLLIENASAVALYAHPQQQGAVEVARKALEVIAKMEGWTERDGGQSLSDAVTVAENALAALSTSAKETGQ